MIVIVMIIIVQENSIVINYILNSYTSNHLCLYICMYVCEYVRVFFLSIELSIYLSIRLSIDPSIYASIYVCIYLSLRPSIYLQYLSIYVYTSHESRYDILLVSAVYLHTVFEYKNIQFSVI